MRPYRSDRSAASRALGRSSYQRIQEERRQLRDLISTLAPYHPADPGEAGEWVTADGKVVHPLSLGGTVPRPR